jgi:hypothetical protein
LVVNVEVLLKGADVRLAAIDMLGGRVDLGQQRIVELRSTRMRLPLQPAGTYLFFLRRRAGDWAELKSELGAAERGVTELFELTRGGGGVFALLPDGTVEPAITSRIGVAGEYAGTEASVLIAMVQALVRR